MKAFISDIHANLEALCSVFDDIEKHNVDEIICLGDIVGYGADPEECVDMVMSKARLTLKGNHDYALINGPAGFNSLAADVIRKTYDLMLPEEPEKEENKECFEPQYYKCRHDEKYSKCLIMRHSALSRWDFEGKIPDTHKEGELFYVHASPFDPLNEYVFPDRSIHWWNPKRIEKIFEEVETFLFCGHTHIPCLITSELKCVYPDQCDNKLTLDMDGKYIVNTGSVGQPRDRDNRACYLLFDEEKRIIEWRRVSYDIEEAMKRIEEMCGKDSWCSLRLMMGR